MMRHAPLLALVALLCACADTNANQVCEAGSFKCDGKTALRCLGDGSGYRVTADCGSLGKVCTTSGCMFCEPGELSCQGQYVMRCNEQGTAYLAKSVYSCDGEKGMICSSNTCVNACDLASKNRSYVGCEYWAVDLDNAVVSSGSAAAQQFAVVLSNPSSLTATVKVWINTAAVGQTPTPKEVTRRTVKPHDLEVILLPAREVDGSPDGQFDTGGGTAVTSNAYKIESTAPIIAYQFNPLSNVGVFSNDASLLVPATALSTASSTQGASYLVMSWPQTIASTKNPKTNFGINLRAFLTVVGTRADTSVKITLSTDIIGDKEKRIKPMKKGQVLTYKLGAYDVLNLETGDFGADFTGTRVDPDKPVAVFSGSEASDVPDFPDLTTRQCCADHLEHQIFPVTTLGRSFIALKTPSRTQALANAGANVKVNKHENEYFRVLSAGEFVQVTTNLDAPYARFSVANRKFAQIKTDRDFTIQASGPVSVGQFVASQDEAGVPSTLPGGDPSFIVLPPVEQFRKDYLFLTPDKYSFDFLLIAAPRGAKVLLDGRTLKDGCDTATGKKICCRKSTVGGVRRPAETADTIYEAYKCQLAFPVIQSTKVPPDNLLPGEQSDGVHTLKADQPVGLVVYGFDAFVSYGYPGGTDLALINLK